AEVAAIVAAARAAGIGRVYLAGLEMAVAALPPDDRPDDFLTATIDAVEALSLLLNGLGA
ncbi:MAG: hypothetical protein QNL98_09120, partial [Mycobacterium sp.]